MVTKGNKVGAYCFTNDFPVQFPYNIYIYFLNVMYTFTKANATQK